MVTHAMPKTLFVFRWIILALTLVIVGLSARGMGFLGFSNDYRDFFSEENPQMVAFETLQNTYDKSDNVMFVVTPSSGTVFTPEILSHIQWLTQEAWQTPYSNRVDSITNFQHTRAEEDDLIVTDLVEDPSVLSEDDLAYIEQVALKEPQINQRLLSQDSRVTGINVNIQLPGLKASMKPRKSPPLP